MRLALGALLLALLACGGKPGGGGDGGGSGGGVGGGGGGLAAAGRAGAVTVGSSLGAQVQTNATHTNLSIVGDVGGFESSNAQYRNRGGGIIK